MVRDETLPTNPARRGGVMCRMRERGAGSLEYLGLFAIIALAILVPVGVNAKQGNLVKIIQWGMCHTYNQGLEILGLPERDCGPHPDAPPENLPPCITYQQDRLLGANGTFRFIRGELTGKDTIVDVVDPVTGKEEAYVFLKNEAGAGVELKEGGKGNLLKKLEGKGINLDAKAVVQGGTGVVYKFDSHKEAQEFLDSRRGNTFKRAVGVITGGKAEALYDGARKGIKKLGGLFGIGNGEDDGPTPSGLTADLAVQADGGISFEKGPKDKKFNFKVEAKALGKAGGQFRYNFDGTSRLEVKYEGEVSLEGGLGANEEAKKKLPWLGNLGVTAGGNLAGAVGYRVDFDKHGRPTNFVLTTESGGGYQWKAGADRVHKKGKSNELTQNTYNLDLTKPENLKAFQEAFPQLIGAQGLSPISPVALLTTDNPVSRRLKENSIQYEQVYDLEGDAYGGDAPDGSEEKGIKIKGVGIGFNDETSKRTLKSARYYDHSDPAAEWRPLLKCTR